MPEFIPKSNFQPFTGTVEDNEDPLRIGRVRVRAHGYHTQDKTLIPTEALPWAHMVHDGSKNLSIPEVNEWVVGYFLDGEEAQKPIVLGILPGIPGEEPTTSRWARNERTDETAIKSSKEQLTSLGDISEPSSPYGAEYPKNKVLETESGHLIEIDDTDGSERIHLYHKSGTFIEIHPDGTIVRKSQNKQYDIAISDINELTQGNKNTEVAGNSTENITGNKVTSLKGLYTLENTAEDLATLINDLITELISLQTVGSPANHIVNPASQAKLQILATRFKTLLK